MICPNPASDVLSAVYREGDSALALRRLQGESVHNYPAILELELALAQRSPYLDVARAWQLILSGAANRRRS